MIIEALFAASLAVQIEPQAKECIVETQKDRSVEMCFTGPVLSAVFKDEGEVVFRMNEIDISALSGDEAKLAALYVRHAAGRWLLGFHPMRMD